MIGLFKTEVLRHGGPWRSLDDEEFATLKWVAWFNTCRLMEPLGYLPQRSMRINLIDASPLQFLLEHSIN
ncbi:MAG: hypothetical protein M3Z05_20740 [Gemmatimonadota bacterium]|nr:hypothetical protein [Gemmatimonadota bacterium]